MGAVDVCMCDFKPAAILCVVPGLAPRVLYLCKTMKSSNGKYMINPDCPAAGQVIRVHSAEIGLSEQCPPTAKTCTSSIRHQDIDRCDGRPYCSVDQSVFRILPSDNQCAENQLGLDFVKISYSCLNCK